MDSVKKTLTNIHALNNFDKQMTYANYWHQINFSANN